MSQAVLKVVIEVEASLARRGNDDFIGNARGRLDIVSPYDSSAPVTALTHSSAGWGRALALAGSCHSLRRSRWVVC
jgi:hypothetical protein